MTTRFYLPSTGAAAVSPTFGAWSATAGADRIAAVRARISSAMSSEATADDGTTGTWLIRQYVTEALAAQTLSGSVKGVIRAQQSHTATNATLAIRIAKCDNDGTNVVEILAITYTQGDTSSEPPEFVTTPTTATSRRFNDGTAVSPGDFILGFSNATINANDRLIFEIGATDESTSTARFPTLVFGDDSASDLAEDMTATAADNPWVEFTADITFPSAGGAASIAVITQNYRNMGLMQ